MSVLKLDSNSTDGSNQIITKSFRISAGLLKYCLLSILLATAWASNAQTIWIGEENTDWFEELNWTNGLPAPGNDAAIPSSPPGDFLPEITQDITVDFILSNANTLTILANFINNGTVINFADGIIMNQGNFENNFIIDNDGDFFVNGTVVNNGTIDNSGMILFETGTEFYNEMDGVIENYGPIKLVDAYFSNSGVLNLNGDLFQSSGIFENYGLLHNNGEIENQECGLFKNFGAISNQFIIRNANIFYDEGNYNGNPVIDDFSLMNSGGIIAADHECTDSDGWTHYSETSSSKILVSIFTGGQDIGTLSDQSLVIKAVNNPYLGSGISNNLNNALYLNADDWYLLNRSWVIATNSPVTTPLKIRFYFSENDYNDIQNTFPLSQNIKELVFYQLKNSEDAYDPDIAEANVNCFGSNNTSSPTTWYKDEVSFSDYAEIEVEELNAAYSAGVKSWLGGTIPFQNSFNVIPDNQNKTVGIQWSTEQESLNQEYVIQRSDDGITFTDLKTIPAIGNTLMLSTYNSIDESPNLLTANYYRLQLHQADGSIRYSDIREANFDTGEISIFPNPSTDELRVKFSGLEEGEVNLIIYDINGQLQFSAVCEVSNNVLVENIYAKTSLAAGIYSLQIQGPYKNESYRFIKIARE